MSAADEADRWFQQARADLAAARDNAEDHPHVACFLAQQAESIVRIARALRLETQRDPDTDQKQKVVRGQEPENDLDLGPGR